MPLNWLDDVGVSAMSFALSKGIVAIPYSISGSLKRRSCKYLETISISQVNPFIFRT